MQNQDLTKQVAYLEFVNDQLLTELTYVDELLKQLGFENGLATLKLAAEEVIEEELD